MHKNHKGICYFYLKFCIKALYIENNKAIILTFLQKRTHLSVRKKAHCYVNITFALEHYHSLNISRTVHAEVLYLSLILVAEVIKANTIEIRIDDPRKSVFYL